MNKTLTHAGCVVVRNDGEKKRYLVISSSSGQYWVLPKGHIKRGETPEQAALRELREETGVVGEIIQPLAIQRRYRKSKDEQVLIQYYLVRMIGTVEPDENRTLRWESKESALNLLSFEEAQDALRDALDILEGMS